MGKRKNFIKREIRMAILEKKILLYLLIFFGCFVSRGYADDNQFFDSKVDYFAEPKQQCSTCKAQDDMNKNVSDILLKTKMNTEFTSGGAAVIDLFLDSSCQFTELAIKNLSAFNQKHPKVAVKVYINGPIEGFLGIAQKLMNEHPIWAVTNDLMGGNAKDLGVFKVPAYIFTVQGKMYRIYGTPDLEETWEKVNATAQ